MAEEGRIGYLAAHISADDEAFAGGLLTTDYELRPLDFRCTAAIHPTAVQRTLYGGVLRQHLFVDLLAMTLLRAADPKPEVVVFQDPLFLYLQRKLDSTPVLWVVGQTSPARGETELVHPSVDTQHLTIECVSGNTTEVFVYSGFGERVVQAKALLEDVAKHFDILEPFCRMPPLLAPILQQPKSSEISK
ncbi:MAG: hypothetical protein WC713_02775 [Candidatus Methylomirabilota bacterium]